MDFVLLGFVLLFLRKSFKFDRRCAHVGLRLTKLFAVSVFLSRYTLSWLQTLDSTHFADASVFHPCERTPGASLSHACGKCGLGDPVWFGFTFLFYLFLTSLEISSLSERRRRLLLSRDGGHLSAWRGIFSCSRWLLSGLSAVGHGDGPGLLPSDAVSIFRGRSVRVVQPLLLFQPGLTGAQLQLWQQLQR